ncbi:hypothetical protein D3C79_946540 [compost metagenome]
MQGAVIAALFAEVTQHGVLIFQGHQVHRAALQFQHMGVLLNLQQVAVVEVLREQRLGSGEHFLDPQGNGLGTVVAETAHP